jgi:hypothetical protein
MIPTGGKFDTNALSPAQMLGVFEGMQQGADTKFGKGKGVAIGRSFFGDEGPTPEQKKAWLDAADKGIEAWAEQFKKVPGLLKYPEMWDTFRTALKKAGDPTDYGEKYDPSKAKDAFNNRDNRLATALGTDVRDANDFVAKIEKAPAAQITSAEGVADAIAKAENGKALKASNVDVFENISEETLSHLIALPDAVSKTLVAFDDGKAKPATGVTPLQIQQLADFDRELRVTGNNDASGVTAAIAKAASLPPAQAKQIKDIFVATLTAGDTRIAAVNAPAAGATPSAAPPVASAGRP